MPQPITALDRHTVVPPLDPAEAAVLNSRLRAGREPRLGDAPLPAATRDAVMDLLQRLASGDGVELASSHAWLSTSQAARAAGISQSYVRKLADAGVLPAVYRGSHRRFRPEDVHAWAASREEATPSAQTVATDPPSTR